MIVYSLMNYQLAVIKHIPYSAIVDWPQ